MDQGEQEREVGKQDFQWLTNTEKGNLAPHLAEYQILRSLGFKKWRKFWSNIQN